MNNVSLMGRLTRDPELRYLPNGGQAVTRFSLAVDRKYSKEKRQEAESKGQPTADFINITAWGKQAEFVANYLEKGNRAIVQGNIQTGSYIGDDGKTVYTTDVRAHAVEPIDWKNRDTNTNSNYTSAETTWNPADTDDSDIPF